jgi:hypothetical protein
MHSNTIVIKTAKGREEVETRQHGLPVRLRALLIPINGVKSVGDISRAHPSGTQCLEWMDQLLEQGFVEIAGSQTVSAHTAPTPAIAPQPPPNTAPPANDAVKITLVKRYLADFVHNTLGFMGGDIVTRIQATDNLPELQSIARSCVEVVTAVAGAKKAQQFQVEVDKLIGKP